MCWAICLCSVLLVPGVRMCLYPCFAALQDISGSEPPPLVLLIVGKPGSPPRTFITSSRHVVWFLTADGCGVQAGWASCLGTKEAREGAGPGHGWMDGWSVQV
ncbi:hypothetical protein LX36DRAFT_662548 [Colletotrichum falcatum]|nr:hypothetical protein LX36DRAFT_662548 [Colletotrichum falcatum]